jgi:hypothetical protein
LRRCFGVFYKAKRKRRRRGKRGICNFVSTCKSQIGACEGEGVVANGDQSLCRADDAYLGISCDAAPESRYSVHECLLKSGSKVSFTSATQSAGE